MQCRSPEMPGYTVFSKGQQCKQVSCVALRHWKQWLCGFGWLILGSCQSRSHSWWQRQVWQAAFTASWRHPGYQHIQSFPSPAYVRSSHGHGSLAQGDAEWRKSKGSRKLNSQGCIRNQVKQISGCSVSPVYKLLTHPAGHDLLHFALTLELLLKELKHL